MALNTEAEDKAEMLISGAYGDLSNHTTRSSLARIADALERIATVMEEEAH